jgi:hypothetical protein
VLVVGSSPRQVQWQVPPVVDDKDDGHWWLRRLPSTHASPNGHLHSLAPVVNCLLLWVASIVVTANSLAGIVTVCASIFASVFASRHAALASCRVSSRQPVAP